MEEAQRALSQRRMRLRGCTIDLVTGRLSGGRNGRLTERERTLLICLIERAGEPVPQSEVAERFGYARSCTTRAVDKAMCTLRKKVERDRRRPEHLVTRYGEGYLFVPFEPSVSPRGGASAETAPRVSAKPGLPTLRGSFVGRGVELAALDRQVHRDRLVTILGLGGVGKTRLVVEYARRQRALAESGWAGGVSFCDLSEAREPDPLVPVVARSLGLGESDATLDSIGAKLAQRGRSLLVLDNAEHVMAAVHRASRLWTESAPELHVVVTSREPLGLRTESRFALGSMTESDAQRLYRQCIDPTGVQLSEGDEAELPCLLERIDRLPLAIELAAARVRLLPPSRLLPRLSDRFRILCSTDPGDRQSSLAAVLDWSFALLSPDEQQGLGQLAVFEGGFTLDAAEAVVRTEAWTLDVLQRLIDLSWVTTSAEGRFRLLVCARAYALGQLPESLDAQRRHGERYARFGQALRKGQVVDRAEIHEELDNLVVACRRAVQRHDPAIAVDTLLAITLAGPFRSWVDLARAVLRLDLPTDLRAEVMRLAAEPSGEETWRASAMGSC